MIIYVTYNQGGNTPANPPHIVTKAIAVAATPASDDGRYIVPVSTLPSLPQQYAVC